MALKILLEGSRSRIGVDPQLSCGLPSPSPLGAPLAPSCPTPYLFSASKLWPPCDFGLPTLSMALHYLVVLPSPSAPEPAGPLSSVHISISRLKSSEMGCHWLSSPFSTRISDHAHPWSNHLLWEGRGLAQPTSPLVLRWTVGTGAVADISSADSLS